MSKKTGNLTISNHNEFRDNHTHRLNIHLKPFFNDQEDSIHNLKDYPFEIPKLENENFFTKYLDSSVPDKNQQKLLAEWVGQSLTSEINGSTKALYLVGEGRNGKSVFINIVEKLHQHVAALELNRLSDSKALSELINASLVTVADAEKKVDEGAFKKLITGDKTTVKLLYRDEFSFRPFAKWLIAANQLPIVSDKSDGMWRRIVFVDFNQKLKDEDIIDDIDSKIIIHNLGYVLFWALEGLKRLMERDWKFLSNDSSIKIAREAKLDNNSILRFITERSLRVRKHTLTTRTSIFKAYVDFCKSREEMPNSERKFWPILQKSFFDENGISFNSDVSAKRIDGKYERMCDLVIDCDEPNETDEISKKESKKINAGEIIEISGSKYKIVEYLDFETQQYLTKMEKV
jgi:P4 family phage/plasmid primase-like protien